LDEAYDDDVDGLGECVATHCRAPYLQCQMSLACFLHKRDSSTTTTTTTSARVRLDACVEDHCRYRTAAPTTAPTALPSSPDDGGTRPTGSGLFFEVFADAAAAAAAASRPDPDPDPAARSNGTTTTTATTGSGSAMFEVPYRHITVGDVQTIPIDGEDELTALPSLRGGVAVLVTSSCELANVDVAALAGAFLIVKRSCQVTPLTLALCPLPLPFALCPLPFALCPLPFALCPCPCPNP
jgi:hypothetical protein